MIYRITNITHTIDKKHPNYNKALKFSYMVKQVGQTMNVGPQGTVYLRVQQVPQDVRVLEANGLIKGEKISEQQYMNDVMRQGIRENIAKKKQ